MSDTTYCPLCGTPCRVVGNTTQHYEPVTDKNSTLGNVDGESCGNHSHGHPLHLCKPKMETGVTDKNSTLEFVRGAMWAYEELTGALIVPASFEEKAKEASHE